MKRFILGVILISGILFNSCDALIPCLNGDGNIVSEERIGSVFTEVESEGDFELHVEYAENTSVIVKSDENLLKYIETTVRDGKLLISSDNDGCINFSDQTEIVVKCPYISSVILAGSGNMEVYNFITNNLSVTHTGSGNISLSNMSISNNLDVNLIGSGNIWLKGRASSASFMLSGSGNIDAEPMRVDVSNVLLSGSGNIHTYVYEFLQVSITGSGDVYYYGSPAKVNTNITGSGYVLER